MNIICDHCQGKIKIPDERVPKDKAFSITCPKCKGKISINPEGEGQDSSESSSPPKSEKKGDGMIGDMASMNGGGEQAPENPFDFLEEGAETAMVCETDGVIRNKIKIHLERMKYYVSEPENAREALKQMRFHDYDIIIINELFGTRDPDSNHILKYLSQLKMTTRRNIFVTLLTERSKSMDPMTAFNRSVNLVINLKDIDNVDKILKQGLTDNETFYRVYKEMLAKLGRF